MNKKKFARVISLYRDGASIRVCVELIIGMSTSDMMASIWIDKFIEKLLTGLILKEVISDETELDYPFLHAIGHRFRESNLF